MSWSAALVTEADSTAPMAHNPFIESMSVFGLVGGTTWVIDTADPATNRSTSYQ